MQSSPLGGYHKPRGVKTSSMKALMEIKTFIRYKDLVDADQQHATFQGLFMCELSL
jgi:hypothetical protein